MESREGVLPGNQEPDLGPCLVRDVLFWGSPPRSRSTLALYSSRFPSLLSPPSSLKGVHRQLTSLFFIH